MIIPNFQFLNCRLLLVAYFVDQGNSYFMFLVIPTLTAYLVSTAEVAKEPFRTVLRILSNVLHGCKPYSLWI